MGRLRKLQFTVEGAGWEASWEKLFLVGLRESPRFDLQRGKAVWVRTQRLDSAGHALILGQGRDQRSLSGFRLQEVPEDGEAGPQKAL